MKFGKTYSRSCKIKNHFAVGFLKDDTTLEIHYRGVKCNIPVENVQEDEIDITPEEFEEKLINVYKETKKQLKGNKK